jgi:hypothetical protein
VNHKAPETEVLHGVSSRQRQEIRQRERAGTEYGKVNQSAGYRDVADESISCKVTSGVSKMKRSSGKDLRREYKRSDFPSGFVRGKHASRLRAGSNIVRLDPEIASAFPTSEAVNEALSAVLKAAKNARMQKGR